MEDLLDIVEQAYGKLHPRALQMRYGYPNTYTVRSIADFLENKEQVLPTRKRLLRDKELYNGSAMVIFQSVIYEEAVREPECENSYPRIGSGLWFMDLAFLMLQEHLFTRCVEADSSIPKIQQEIERMRAAYHNGKLSDVTGTLPVRSQLDIPGGSAIATVGMRYDPGKDLCMLAWYDEHGSPARAYGKVPLLRLEPQIA